MISRRRFLASITAAAGLSGCGLLNIDPYHVLVRSDRITSLEEERRVLGKAMLSKTSDGAVTVLHVAGTPYERGYQHGALLRDQVRDNLEYLYERALGTFKSDELFMECFERQRPFIPDRYVDEMHGLAHGSKLPLNLIHAVHALPEMTEWGGKKRIKEIVKQMISGDLGTSCSNFAACGEATADGSMYTLRILDWGLHRISRLHEYPLVTVNHYEDGTAGANIGWMGFLGAVSGMNSRGITLGEMGYGDPPGETLSGLPMPFLLRDVLERSGSLKDVRGILQSAPPTNSFVFLMSDGKTKEAELYVRAPGRFEIHRPGSELVENDRNFPAIERVAYGGHFDEKMKNSLTEQYGKITPEVIMEKMVPEMAMHSNFQNVVYDPGHLRFWVANARNSGERAAEAPYSYFDLSAALAEYGASKT